MATSPITPPQRPPLLERSEQLAILAGRIDRLAKAREGSLVLLRGEAGAGKTALVQWFCDQHCPPARALWGGCDPLFAPRALGPFADIARVTGGDLEELVECGGRSHEVLDALATEVATRTPTLVVLEDLHWADEATLDVLRLLGRRIDGVRALVIATYRDDELGPSHPLRVVVGELVRAPGTTTIDLAPLSPGGVAQLADPYGIDADELHRTTGGNPFFVVEALTAQTGQIPGTVRDAVLARVAGVSARGRELLEVLTIVRPGAELPELEAIAGAAIEALDECLASGVVIPVGQGVAFRHELERLVIEESLPPHRQPALHARALQAMIAAGEASDLARLAHHADAAGDAQAVLRFAPQAAEHASASGAHRESAAQYARALGYAERLAPERRAELLERCAYEYMVTDQTDEAIETLRAAIGLHRELGDARAEGRALEQLSNVLWCPGRVAEARDAALQSVALLELGTPGRELAMAYSRLAQLCMDSEDADGAAAWGARALELAETMGETAIAIHTLNSVGTGALLRGDERGKEQLNRSLALATEAGLDDAVSRALTHLAWTAVRQRDYVFAAERLEMALRHASDHGVELRRGYVLGYRALLELDLGRWDDALDTAAIVLREPRRSRVPRIDALIVVGCVRARRGDPDVWTPLDEALALAERGEELQANAPVAAARAEVFWLQGKRDEVEQATAGALALARKWRSRWFTAELMVWRRRTGAVDEFAEDEVTGPYALELAGDWAGAAAAWRELGCPYETALALASSGEEGAMREALGLVQQLGATPAAAIVARRLRERGVRALPRGPRPSTQSNPAGLTTRELEVLTLLMEGMRNAQIAERLVLSPKTVDHHVSSILSKLDVSNRGEAAATAARLGLATPN
jgi:DNA-binding CsgD family transcriptional regulator/tetratricopeptide (TPR) repeat protein